MLFSWSEAGLGSTPHSAHFTCPWYFPAICLFRLHIPVKMPGSWVYRLGLILLELRDGIVRMAVQPPEAACEPVAWLGEAVGSVGGVLLSPT